MSASRSALLLAAILAAAPPGCVQQDDAAYVVARFALPAGTKADDAASPVRDGNGFLYLVDHPLFVSVRVSAPDMEPVEVSYPDSAASVDAAGETLDFPPIEVPPGSQRRATALALLHEGGKPVAYLPQETEVVDLDPGSTASVAITLSQQTAGKVYGSCEAAMSLLLMETDHLVVLDQVPCEDGTYSFLSAPWGVPLTVASVQHDLISYDADEFFVLSGEVPGISFDAL